MGRKRQIGWLAAGLMAVPFAARAQNVPGRLDFSDSIRMVDCDPASSAPCFRLKFNIVDAQGAPLPAQIPPPEKLAGSINVMVGDQAITPFFAVAGGETQAVRARVALVLIDISGSMNRPLATGQTRFEAAKMAISSFLDGFQDGVDRVAVVPFESHQVEPTIRGATFATTRQAALQQVQALPQPQSRNNTGLFSAVTIGLDVLSEQLKNPSAGTMPPEAMVMLMTDGTNEVLKGDDPGLLAGPEGLATASAKVKSSGVQIIGVGFGNRNEIDETALRQISTKYYMTADAATLARIFTVARTLLSSRIQATFTSPWPDRASLAGRTLRVSVKLKLPSGQELASDVKTWATPQIGLPVFEGKCGADELKALYTHAAPPSSNAWISVLRPVLVFIGFGALLLVMWFWIPRLVWADQYIGIVPEKRWANQNTAKTNRPAPAGFQQGKPGAQSPRAPSDQTIVAPRTDFTKTRLGPLPPGRGPRG